jgi:hypothetical protein
MSVPEEFSTTLVNNTETRVLHYGVVLSRIVSEFVTPEPKFVFTVYRKVR